MGTDWLAEESSTLFRMALSRKRILNVFSNHKKVIENYFFMTVLQFLNTFFYFIIYPYLIRTLGKDSYGQYVFSLSIITYFVMFINFGFDNPAIKEIAEHPCDKQANSKVLSAIFTSKIYFLGLSLVALLAMVIFIPFFNNNWESYVLLFPMTLSNILFPSWYFAGIQKMAYTTIIQFIVKVCSLSFIFFLVHAPQDLNVYISITSGASVIGGVLGYLIVRYKEKIHIAWSSMSDVKFQIKEALPFFLSTSMGTIRQQGTSTILGIFFTMGDVAIYDLAYKIINLPIIIFSNISGALFPKVVKDYSISYVRKLIKLHALLGLLVVIGVVLFGKWIVLLLGGEQMIASYYFAVILSVMVFTWLVGMSYINFLFIPNHMYYQITKNQIISFVSYFSVCLFGILIYKNIFIIAAALVVAGLSEFVYCNYVIRKNKLLCPSLKSQS